MRVGLRRCESGIYLLDRNSRGSVGKTYSRAVGCNISKDNIRQQDLFAQQEIAVYTPGRIENWGSFDNEAWVAKDSRSVVVNLPGWTMQYCLLKTAVFPTYRKTGIDHDVSLS